MTVALSAAVVVFGALLFLLLGAQVEMFRDLAQIRELSGLLDQPMDVDLAGAVGGQPSSFGLPPQLDGSTAAIVLFLSDKCGTCRTIATSLDGRIPDGLWLVLDPASPTEDPELALSFDAGASRLLVDRQRDISSRLNVRVMPAAIVIKNGRFSHASTVPSTRQLSTVLESIRAAENRSANAEHV